MDPVLFPDTATLVIDHLTEWLPTAEVDAPVHGEEPNPQPDEFIVVKRIGGPRRTLVSDGAHLWIGAWATDNVRAHDIAQVARSFVNAMNGEVVGGVQVYRVEEHSGPHEDPDPDSGTPRYSFQSTVSVRGASLPTGS